MNFLNPFRDYPHLSRIARRYNWTVPIVAGLGIANGLLEGIGIGLLIPLLATLVPGGGGQVGGGLLGILDEFAADSDWHTRVVIIALTMLAIVCVKNVLQAGSRIFVAWIDGCAGHEIRCALADRLHSTGYPFFLKENPARLIQIISAEAWHASGAMRAAFTRVASLAAIFAFCIMLLLVSWRLTLVFGVGVLLIRGVQSVFVKRLQRLSAATALSNWLLTARMMFAVNGARLIRVFSSQAFERAYFSRRSEDVRDTMFVVEQTNAVLSPALEVLHLTLLLTIMIASTFMGVAFPVLAAFLVLLNRLQPHLRELEASVGQMAAESGQVREVEWLLDPSGKPVGPQGWKRFDRLKHGIEIRDVSFRYDARGDDQPSLANVGMLIKKGRSTALIGPSGAGKSTIVNLICRLVEPTSGAILVDGTQLSELDPGSWLSAIAIAGQDIDIIEGSVSENIAYGQENLGLGDITEAARMADAHGFIERLPDGYATEIQASGLNLSGGQRQRLAIARALARRPQILILDEATNAVDGLSEATIMKLLREVNDHLTTIVVSHRASTLAMCDHGVVIADGRVVKAGPLATLDAWQRMSVA